MIGSIAYSVVLVRMEENANIEDAKTKIKESTKPAAKAMRTFFGIFGEDGDFGKVASSTTFKFALSLRFARVSGAIWATVSAIAFACVGFSSRTIASKTSVSSTGLKVIFLLS